MVAKVKQVMEKLEIINLKLDFIEKHIVDRDTMLTKSEEKRLDKGLRDYKQAKSVSLEKLKKKRR